MKKKNGPDQFNKTLKKKDKKHALLKQSLKQYDSIICHQMTWQIWLKFSNVRILFVNSTLTKVIVENNLAYSLFDVFFVHNEINTINESGL